MELLRIPNLSLFLCCLLFILRSDHAWAQSDPVIAVTKISATSGGFTDTLDAGAKFGKAVAGIGDIDNDGIADVAVSSMEDQGGSLEGIIWLLFLNSDGSVKGHNKLGSSLGGMSALDAGDNFGTRLASIGDLNNDGVPDIAVSARGDDDGGANNGAIYILFLSRKGNVLAQQKISALEGGFTGSIDPDDSFGSAVAGIGDLDNDGITELLVGAYQDDDGSTDKGAAWVLFMRRDGTVRAQQKLSATQGGLVGVPTSAGDEFGIGASPIGDVDHDGILDVAISTRREDQLGAVHILFLNADGTVKGHQKITEGAGGLQATFNNWDGFGFGIAKADAHDEEPKLLSGVRLFDDGGDFAGGAWLLDLGENGTVIDEEQISQNVGHGSIPLGLASGDQFGYAVGSVGDLDGNGSMDLVVGSHGDDDGATDAGAVRVLFVAPPASEPRISVEVGSLDHTATAIGSIDITVSNVAGTVGYIWNDTSLVGGSIDQLPMGTYQVEVQEDGQPLSTLKIGVGHDTRWREINGFERENGGWVRVKDGAPWGTATSANRIPLSGDGWVEWNVVPSDLVRVIGISTSDHGTDSLDHVQHGFYLDPYGRCYTIDSLQLAYAGRYLENVTMRLQIDQGQLIYLLDADTVHSTPISAVDRRIVAAVNGVGGQLPDVRTSFYKGLMVELIDQNVTIYEPQKGSIEAVPSWGSPPYSFKWSTGSTDPVITGLAEGQYTVTVSDALGDSVVMVEDIAMDVTYFELDGIELADDQLTKRTGEGWDNAYAASENIIESGEEGWVQAKLLTPDAKMALALAELDGPTKYGVTIENGILHSFFNGGKENTSVIFGDIEQVFEVEESDVVRIERKLNTGSSGAVILFLLNGKEFLAFNETNEHRDLILEVDMHSGTSQIAQIEGKFSHHRYNEDDCYSDNYNFVRTVVYNEDGSVASLSKEYMDVFGRTIQVQSKDLSTNNVLVSETRFDRYGRPAIQSLPAPAYKSTVECYRKKFMSDPAGNEYDATYFDQPDLNGSTGEVHAPAPVSDQLKGKLGWYYSDQNTEEPYVATSSYPFSRTVYSHDVTSQVLEQYSAGDHHHPGSGHGTRTISMMATAALHRVTDYTGAFVAWGAPSFIRKTITIDADGNESITYSNAGQVLATCRSGTNNSCTEQPFMAVMRSKGNRAVDLHIPAGQKDPNGQGWSSIRLPVTLAHPIVETADVIFHLTDIETGKRLESGIDYDILDQENYHVKFLGNYATGTSFIRFSYEYDLDYTTILDNPLGLDGQYATSPWSLDELPDQVVHYKLDYGQWSLYRYDRRGQLISIVPPEGVDCSFDPSLLSLSPTYVEEREILDISLRAQGEPLQGTVDELIGTDLLDVETALGINTTHHPNFTQGILLNIRPFGRDPEWSEPDPTPHGYFPISNVPAQRANYDPSPVTCDYVFYHPGGRPETVITAEEMHLQGALAAGGTVTPGAYGPKKMRLDPGVLQQRKVSGMPNGDDIILSLLCPPTHCFNGVHDTGCGETGVDMGPPCVPPPCDGHEPRAYRHFRVALEVYGNGTAGEVVFTNRTFEATLMQTCECKYFWSPTITTQPELLLHFSDQQIQSVNDIKVRLVSVEIGDNFEGQIVWTPYDQGSYFHDYARFLSFFVDLNYQTSVVPDPPDHHMITENTYNGQGHLYRTSDPDRGTTELVYDATDQVRFSQNAQQNVAGTNGKKAFSFVDYDLAGRPVRSGEYEYMPGQGPGDVQFAPMDDNTTYQAGTFTTLDEDVLNGTTTFANANLREVSEVFYDLPAPDFPVATYPGYQQTVLPGQVSRTGNEETSTWYSYDVRGRLQYTVHHVVPIGRYYTMHYVYGIKGELGQVIYQRDQPAEAYYHHFEYDNNGRLKRVLTGGSQASTAVERAEYHYYQHGPLKRVELGDDLQGMDYAYTIHGWLKGINSPDDNSRDPGTDGHAGTAHAHFANDLFGMALGYFDGDYDRSSIQIYTGIGLADDDDPLKPEGQPSYTGRIAAQRWIREETGTGVEYEGTPLIYTYRYDELGQLVKANFGTLQANVIPNAKGPGPLVTFNDDYQLWNVLYDKNGNLTQAKRNGYGAARAMDDLTYTYQTDGTGQLTGNRLLSVSDAVSASTFGVDLPSGQAANNYQYNAVGQLEADLQAGHYYDYNAAGLIRTVYSNAQKTTKVAEFLYDDRGQRLKKTSYQSNGTTVTRETWYFTDASGGLVQTSVVEHVIPGLPNSYVTTKRLPVSGMGRIGHYLPDTEEFHYEMTDHLGNVRVVFSDLNGPDVVELHDYYPFGMELPGRSYSSTGTPRYGYQSQEYDDEVGQSHFELRQFDARLGRWLVPDPMGQYHSPYLAMGNDPINRFDPDGGFDYNDVYASSGLSAESSTNWTPETWGLLQTWGMSDFAGIVGDLLAADGWSLNAYFAETTGNDYLDGGDRLESVGWNDKNGVRHTTYYDNVGGHRNWSLTKSDFMTSSGLNWDAVGQSMDGAADPRSKEAFLERERQKPLGNIKYVPILGAAAQTVQSMNKGEYGWAAFHATLGATDAFLVKAAAVGAARLLSKDVGATIVGEGMKRVSVEAAKRPGAVFLNNMPNFTGTAEQITSQMMAYNRKWLLKQMRSGRNIVDIGLDINRTNPSIFYQMEQRMIKNYLKLHPNAFKVIRP